MHDTDYLGPAPAGTTWVLAHTTHLHSTDEPYTYIESFADVRTAVHELAERVRPRWTRQRSRITAEEITAQEVSTSLPAQTNPTFRRAGGKAARRCFQSAANAGSTLI